MAIKTILVAASGGSATAGSVELACELAERFRAHLEGYHVLLDPQAALASMGEEAGLGLTGTLIESIEAVGRVRAEETRSVFAKILVRREIALGEGPHAVGHRAPGDRKAAMPRFWSPTVHASLIWWSSGVPSGRLDSRTPTRSNRSLRTLDGLFWWLRLTRLPLSALPSRSRGTARLSPCERCPRACRFL